MGKVRRSSKKFQTISLADQILDDQSVRPSGRVKLREEKDVDDKFVDDKLSKRILEQARIQQEELEEECGSKSRKSVRKSKTAVLGSSDRHDSSSSSDEELASEDEQYFENIEINEEDEKALEKFMSKNPPACQTLADIIMEKIKEKETEMQTHMSENTGIHMKQLDEKVVEMYRSVQQILSKYRSGKLPKAFKIIPALRNWEQILYLTKPDKWTAAAMYQATRIFTSNLNTKMAQRFFNLVLLPRIRDDIAEYKRLNYHLYLAVSKSLYKPAAFFKGFLLPLCESGTCTLQEATILSSILVKNSIPMLHSAAAILKIAEMDYTGASSIFLRMLLEKKYALPYRVIDAIVYHFLRFLNDKRDLPVLWHQCFLTFVQRYKENVSDDQKGVLRDVLRVHVHHQITPEIHRELNHSKSREARAAECAMSMD